MKIIVGLFVLIVAVDAFRGGPMSSGFVRKQDQALNRWVILVCCLSYYYYFYYYDHNHFF